MTEVIPAHIFPVPNQEVGYDLAAKQIALLIAPSHKIFIRGNVVHEYDRTSGLIPLDAERFCALLDSDFSTNKKACRTARCEINDGKKAWRSARMTASSAKILLKTTAIRDGLPCIRQVCACPIISPCVLNDRDGFIETSGGILGSGYHAHAGGTLIECAYDVHPVPFEQARDSLIKLLADFDFTDPSDASRAIASLISPALKMGGWIDDDFPLDIAEADQSQSGKTYRQKIVCAIYKEHPQPSHLPSAASAHSMKQFRRR